MARKSILLVVLLAAFAGAACTKEAPRSDDARGLAVTGNGSAVLKHKAVLITLNGLGSAKERADATTMAEEALVPMVAAVRVSAPDATVTVDDPALRSAGASVRMWQRAFVKLPDDTKVETVLRAVFAACDDSRLCGWTVELLPSDPASAVRDARRNAMDDARRRATELAEAIDVRVGEPFAVHETTMRPVGSMQLHQPFTETGLRGYIEELVAVRTAPAKSIPLITLDVRFEILR